MTDTIYCGIDPGKSGFVAFLYDGKIETWPTPTVRCGKGTKREYDTTAMAEILRRFSGRDNMFLAIEQQQAYPKQGGSSNFTTGLGYGLWLGIISALKIPHVRVHPKTWKKVMLAGIPPGDNKARSILAAKRLFPSVDYRRTEKCRNDDDNKAEAILLAEYGRRLRG